MIPQKWGVAVVGFGGVLGHQNLHNKRQYFEDFGCVGDIVRLDPQSAGLLALGNI